MSSIAKTPQELTRPSPQYVDTRYKIFSQNVALNYIHQVNRVNVILAYFY